MNLNGADKSSQSRKPSESLGQKPESQTFSPEPTAHRGSELLCQDDLLESQLSSGWVEGPSENRNLGTWGFGRVKLFEDVGLKILRASAWASGSRI